MSEGTNDCVGNGDTVTFNCTVMGSAGGATVWRGSAFNCALNDITLFHSAYKSEHGAIGMCNNGAIMAQSLGVEDSYYTSQLNVNVSSNMIGKTIMCVNVLNLTSEMVHFLTTINNQTGKLWLCMIYTINSHPRN